MRLGFIGTGKIASSVITGICTSKISFQKILISRSNKNISRKLKKRLIESQNGLLYQIVRKKKQ